jgi:undecaprenyl diphosphate synthase
MPRLLGHRRGYRNLRAVLLDVADLGIPVLTVYVFSAENWRRPRVEVEALLRLIEEAAREELSVLHRNNVRVIVSGRLQELPDSLQAALRDGAEVTRENTRIVLNLAINYGGRAEIVDAVREIVKEATLGRVRPEDVDEEAVSQLLYHPELPDPDLIIRTGGEFRTSNFLLWQSAYAEFHSAPALWPDFGEADLFKALLDFQRRTRKFGGVADG